MKPDTEYYPLGPPGAPGMKPEPGHAADSGGRASTSARSPPAASSSQSDTATTADAAGAGGGASDGVSRRSAGSNSNTSASPKPAPAPKPKYNAAREWLYRLVTFPNYFTPCSTCCNPAATPKREQLMTLFDTRAPHRVFCCHCPSPVRGGAHHYSASHGRDGALLQVRRSSFKNAVNASDIARFGCDLAGVQQYTLNGTKIIYLAREASTKKPGHGAPPPASCTVDGRAMMDKSSLYCSLMCKMQAEDPGFTAWLDAQDPSVRILAQVAANAPPVPTAACRRAGYGGSSCARDSSPSRSGSGHSQGGALDGLAGASGYGTGGYGGAAASSRPYVPPSNPRPVKAQRVRVMQVAPTGSGGSSDTRPSPPLALLPRLDGGGAARQPVARELLPAAGATARAAAAAAAAAAFAGPSTASMASSAAAAAARGALGVAGLAPARSQITADACAALAAGIQRATAAQQGRLAGQQQQQQQPRAGAVGLPAQTSRALQDAVMAALLEPHHQPAAPTSPHPPLALACAGSGDSSLSCLSSAAPEPWLAPAPPAPVAQPGASAGVLGLLDGGLALQPGGGYGGYAGPCPWSASHELEGLLGTAGFDGLGFDAHGDGMLGDGLLAPHPVPAAGGLF